MLRYQEDNELHRDFHGTTNATLDYIAQHYGPAALKLILRKMGHDVYRSIREKLAHDDTSELLEHLNWFYGREGAEYSLIVKNNEIRFEVFDCPAQRHLKKLGLPISPYCCWQTSEVNNGICENTPWKSDVEIVAPGHCIQIFRKANVNDSK